MTRLVFSLLLIVLYLMPAMASAHAHGDSKQAQTEALATVEKITDTIYMVHDVGGNIAVSKGLDGLFIIDDGLSEKRQAVLDAVKQISDQPVKILVNTHWHYDHAGNNESFGDKGTMIIAHENVRTRLKNGQTIGAFNKVIDPAQEKVLPTLTYQDGVKIYLNGDEIEIISMAPAHTDGDSIIFWPEKNILHTGDLYFNNAFPFIDASSGGSLNGMIEGTDKILSLVDDKTKIIPGHGELATKKDLELYQAMLKTVSERIDSANSEKMTKEQWIDSKPFADLDAKWGQGFMSTDKFADVVWDAP